MNNLHPTREAWLTAAYRGLEPVFVRVERPILSPVRLSVGFPSSGGLTQARRRVGECWGIEASSSGICEILVSPLLDDPLEVLATVAHELGHAVLGTKIGHKRPFADLMIAIGLEGKASATVPGDLFRATVTDLLEELGPFPHDKLLPLAKDLREKVKIFKCTCPRCGYVCRVIRRWLEVAGPPICPLDKIAMEEG